LPAALLAVLLLAATVDPRLAEPPWLLADVGARDTTAASLPASLICGSNRPWRWPWPVCRRVPR